MGRSCCPCGPCPSVRGWNGPLRFPAVASVAQGSRCNRDKTASEAFSTVRGVGARFLSWKHCLAILTPYTYGRGLRISCTPLTLDCMRLICESNQQYAISQPAMKRSRGGVPSYRDSAKLPRHASFHDKLQYSLDATKSGRTHECRRYGFRLLWRVIPDGLTAHERLFLFSFTVTTREEIEFLVTELRVKL